MRQLRDDTHLILDGEVRVYRRERSRRWQAAFVIDGRVEEGYQIILNAKAEAAREGRRFVSYDLDKVYEECLVALDLKDDLKALLWAKFEVSLSTEALRKYLKLLPDFEDIEAEDRALEYAEQHPSVASAARFFVEWSQKDRAAKVILERSDELDGAPCLLQLSPSAARTTPLRGILTAQLPNLAKWSDRSSAEDLRK